MLSTTAYVITFHSVQYSAYCTSREDNIAHRGDHTHTHERWHKQIKQRSSFTRSDMNSSERVTGLNLEFQILGISLMITTEYWKQSAQCADTVYSYMLFCYLLCSQSRHLYLCATSSTWLTTLTHQSTHTHTISTLIFMGHIFWRLHAFRQQCTTCEQFISDVVLEPLQFIKHYNWACTLFQTLLGQFRTCPSVLVREVASFQR